MTKMRAVGLAIALSACERAGDAPIDVASLGSQVQPPSPMALVRAPTTLAQLKQLVPAARDELLHGYRLDPGSRNPRQYARVANGAVTELVLEIDGDGAAALTKAWGPPLQDSSHDSPRWKNEKTGWQAVADCGGGSKAVPVAKGCAVTFSRYLPLAAIATAHVAPAGRLAAVVPGTSVADARAASGLPLPDVGTWRGPSEIEDSTEEVKIRDGRVAGVSIMVPSAARELLVKAWGPPRPTGDKEDAWIDPSSGAGAVTMTLSSKIEVQYDRYWTVDHVLDVVEDILARPTLDGSTATHSELRVKHERDSDYTLELPPTDISISIISDRTNVTLFDGAPREALWLFSLDETRQAELRATLEKRWGAPKESTKDGETTLTFPKGQSMRIFESSVYLRIEDTRS